MAGEDLTHLLLPPPEREKKRASYPDALPVLPATAAGWSSLPDDLVRRIADSFLATNDVDCYMCFRAVCLSWRAATDDPRNNPSAPRFQPRQWIVLDDAQGKLLLLNTGTGRSVNATSCGFGCTYGALHENLRIGRCAQGGHRDWEVRDCTEHRQICHLHWSLSVDASKFPGIEADCVYYTQHLGSSARICKYSLKNKKPEWISEAAEFVKQDTLSLVTDRPFTIIQLLCSYTINVPDSQLPL
ncbi:unnamed protein product [Alopecurus aequalis]